MKKSLSYSDWSVTAFLLIIILSMIVTAKVRSIWISSLIGEEEMKEVVVIVEGAVKKPGEYRIALGEKLAEVVAQAKPLKNADLKKIPLERAVEAPLTIIVEELREVVVFVGGEVAQAVEVTLPVGSRICDLRSKVELTPASDKGFFRRRKVLKDGEKIEVPKKRA